MARLSAELGPLHARHAEELAREDARLGFPALLEQEYRRYKAERAVPLIRLGSLVAVLLYLLALGLDYASQLRLGPGWRYIALFVLLAPVSTLPAAVTLHPRWRLHAWAVATTTTSINAIALIALGAGFTARGLAFPHGVAAFSLMYFYFLCGLRFWIAFPLAAATVAGYGIAALAAGLPFTQLLDVLFPLFGVLVLGGIACYVLEWTERRNWLRAQLLEELSVRDDLTGLHNRRHFYDQGEKLLAHARREGRRVGVLLIDVDHFKQFNDAKGHLAGDDCLMKVADALRSLARRPLDVLARLGGDEFALLVCEAQAESLLQHGEQARAVVDALGLPNPGIPAGGVTVSVGAALSPTQGHMDLERLLNHADGALYRGKALGRNRVTLAASE